MLKSPGRERHVFDVNYGNPSSPTPRKSSTSRDYRRSCLLAPSSPLTPPLSSREPVVFLALQATEHIESYEFVARVALRPGEKNLISNNFSSHICTPGEKKKISSPSFSRIVKLLFTKETRKFSIATGR